MHRFFVPPEVVGVERVRIAGPVAHQVRSVLRLRIGERIVLLDNRGWEYEVELTELTAGAIECRLVERRPAGGEPCLRIVLYQALLKADKFELVLQKGTELGVQAFVPIVSERTMVQRPAEVGAGKLDRWRRILCEAAEQSGRGLVPELAAPQPLAAACARVGDRAFLLWEGERSRRLADVLAPGEVGGREPLNLFVGPEGGFSAAEAELAAAHGVASVGLGRRILRAETAGLVAATIALYEARDLG